MYEASLELQGVHFCELFAGCAVISLAYMFLNAPVIRPWDIAYSESDDVSVHGWVLYQLASMGIVAFSILACLVNP